MSTEVSGKFREKADLTYEQCFQMRFGAIPFLAKELESVLGREKALEIIRKTSEEYACAAAGKRPIKDFEEFKAFVKQTHRSPFCSHSMTVTYPAETRDRIMFNVTECLWAKTFRDMNAADLGYVICCQQDFASAKAQNPRIGLKRTKTLMQGDDCCDHIYYWEE